MPAASATRQKFRRYLTDSLQRRKTSPLCHGTKSLPRYPLRGRVRVALLRLHRDC
jgi:hypothetical protein